MTEEETSNSTDLHTPDQGMVVVAAVLFEGGLAPLALALGWLLGRSPLEGFSWSIRDAILGVLAALPMYAMFQLLMRWPIGPLKRIRRFFEDELTPLFGSRPDSDLALISVAAGVGEEMLFRGVLQGVLSLWLGTWEGMVAASVLFGLVHPITATYVLVAGLLGAYLGTVWIFSGNLLVVMIAHALYDFLALRALFRRRLLSPTAVDRQIPG
ncbi:CPBP family intramembrane glutamic endopeptidase [Singulisphaera sp. Ch08]|uniref:CPBP family intramembrane glutamic endopeptidase n=1 Tax=Singulisphaera sp. Ch08 TaxID=3120278 RepID=A0AAU7CIF9_9BACT